MVSNGVVAVGADTWAVEVIPLEQGADILRGVPDPAADERHLHPREHQHGELVKDKAWYFMFVLGHNKYQGAVQSMINPVAIR